MSKRTFTWEERMASLASVRIRNLQQEEYERQQKELEDLPVPERPENYEGPWA